MGFRGFLTKHPVTLFHYLDWVPVIWRVSVLARHARNMAQTLQNMSFKQLHNFN